MRSICKNGCILDNFGQKSTQFFPNWMFFVAIWYSDGSQNHASRGIEVVEILKSTLSIPVQMFFKDPPPDSISINLKVSTYHEHIYTFFASRSARYNKSYHIWPKITVVPRGSNLIKISFPIFN